MILYHGSKTIVESPEIRIQKYNKDFYFGFYCTLFPEQAIRWAIRFDGVGYLNEYCYTLDDSLKIKQFPEMSEEWLDFIVACRLGKPHDYDIVEGPMADDSTYGAVAKFCSSPIKILASRMNLNFSIIWPIILYKDQWMQSILREA